MSLLQVTDVSKHFGGVTAVDRCTLSIERGEIHALIGPNGAGKSTLIAMIAGMLPPSQGQIHFAGQAITHLPAHARVRLGLARTFQMTSIFPPDSVLDNLALAVQARSGSSFRFWAPVRREHHLFEEAAALAAEVGLHTRLDTPAMALSYGEQRQLEVALALAVRPQLLLLDEPMAGMGPEESAQMVNLIASLAKRLTILLVEHDMDAVFRLADRISVLLFGHVIATDTPAAIRQNSEVQKAYLGDGR
ncbi:MAG: ABC transporter ATP-binding protein [Caldilineaceae bacterium]